ncbi:MAG: U32 family peptidase [Syntrophobacteraceae bacterium]|nr:U32 family peptidase [Syntrophobacteraceae bacterium]
MDVSGRTRSPGPELLSPGGSLEKLRIAFLYGADAVYASGKDFGLRGFANNFDEKELAAASRIAHGLGKKLYVTVNIFARRSDLEKLPAYLEYLQELHIDALIISDPGVLLLARQYAPEVAVHLSTQANTTNSLSVKFWQEQGVRRINPARELSFAEIAEIVKSSEAEIEIFVHGAMCMSYSGRCLMSGFLNAPKPLSGKDGAGNPARPYVMNRSANSGFCTQPCRWSWGLVEEKRPGEVFPVEQDGRGSYILNSKDLCLLEEIGPLMGLGIDSFKIEGRMKGALYVASVTRAYRQAINRFAKPVSATGAETAGMEDLQRISHRPYTKGNLFAGEQTGAPDVETRISYVQTHTLAGLVRSGQEPGESPACSEGGKIFLEARSRLVPGQILEFLNPDGSTSSHLLGSFEDTCGNRLTQANPNTLIRFCVDFPVFPFQAARVCN